MIIKGVAGDLVLAFYVAGLAVVVLAALGSLTLRRLYPRLHFLTPMTSVGAPLIAIALGIQNGWGLTTGQILLIAGLLAGTGPVLADATGRLAAQRDGLIQEEPPA
jgi:multicomponent Na+:H+ antiporter subunit G